MQEVLNFNNVAIVSVKGNDYRTHFLYMSKDDATNIINNSDLSENVNYYKFFLNIKMDGKTTCYQRNRKRLSRKDVSEFATLVFCNYY